MNNAQQGPAARPSAMAEQVRAHPESFVGRQGRALQRQPVEELLMGVEGRKPRRAEPARDDQHDHQAAGKSQGVSEELAPGVGHKAGREGQRNAPIFQPRTWLRKGSLEPPRQIVGVAGNACVESGLSAGFRTEMER